MSEVRWIAEPASGSPILIVALQGLFDIAGAATDAVDHLAEQSLTRTRIASIEDHMYQVLPGATRPEVLVSDRIPAGGSGEYFDQVTTCWV